MPAEKFHKACKHEAYAPWKDTPQRFPRMAGRVVNGYPCWSLIISRPSSYRALEMLIQLC